MRKTILGAYALLQCMASFAQPNNPADKAGARFQQSFEYMANEIQSGRLAKYDQPTLDAYAEKLGLDYPVSIDLAMNIYQKMHDPAFDLDAYVNASDVSKEQKTLFTESLQALAKYPIADLQKFIEGKVDAIQSSGMDEKTRYDQLSFLSILYHSTELRAPRSGPDSPDGSSFPCSGSPMACGAAIGYIIGSILCPTPLCTAGAALVGALIGGIIGGSH